MRDDQGSRSGWARTREAVSSLATAPKRLRTDSFGLAVPAQNHAPDQIVDVPDIGVAGPQSAAIDRFEIRARDRGLLSGLVGHRRLPRTDECTGPGGILMVARVVTIKAAGDQVGQVLDYYAGLAADQLDRGGSGRGPVDYYLDPNEPPGRWWGTGCTALGLTPGRPVLPDQLRALLEARHPSDGRRLGRGFGDRSARGFDATFSAPKSVSVLWGLTEDPWVRTEVAAAQDAAVDAALAWVERHGLVTRRGFGGVDQVDARGLAVAVFRQHTSRTADPQLHTHAVIASKVQDGTGMWLALDARWLKTQQRSLSWVYDAALRSELAGRLGLEWQPVPDGSGQADVVGVPEALVEVFSKRSRQVDAKLAELIARWADEYDGAEPGPRDLYLLERRAVTASRPGKDHAVDAAVLRADWQAQARAAGHRLDRLPGGQGGLPGTEPIDAEAVITTALERVAADQSEWLATDISRHIAALLPPGGAARAEELTALVDQLTVRAVARCEELHPPASAATPRRRDGRPISEHVTDRRLTTPAVLAEEADLLQWAAAAVDHSTTSPAATEEAQEAAARAVAGHAALVLVVGPAGAGKTTALAAAVDRLRAQGRPVLGAAPSGKAADVLARQAGCPALTLAKLLADTRRHLPPGTTVVLDEAGMASTEDLVRLVDLARANRWRLVCVGDPAQLPAVGRGGMFAHWCQALPAHHLEEVRRFTHAWEADASLALRAGDPHAATVYAEAGRVRTVHPATLADQVARQHDRLTAHGRTVAITTASAGTAQAINVEIQHRRNPTRSGPNVALADGTGAFAGDRIATRRNDPTLLTTTGAEVRNRHTWTVTTVHRGGDLTVTNPDRGTVRLPGGYVARHVELGWATTGYGNQGITVDAGIAVVEPAATRAGIYVAMTRGRLGNFAWIPDPTGRADPADALAQGITRPPNASTAHATRTCLHRQAGLEPPAPDAVARVPADLVERMLARLDALSATVPAGRSPGR
jgi:conjugative relaxase-like TrwC/TraI family protein